MKIMRKAAVSIDQVITNNHLKDMKRALTLNIQIISNLLNTIRSNLIRTITNQTTINKMIYRMIKVIVMIVTTTKSKIILIHQTLGIVIHQTLVVIIHKTMGITLHRILGIIINQILDIIMHHIHNSNHNDQYSQEDNNNYYNDNHYDRVDTVVA